LVVNYANISYGEDVDAVNGPANLIYYPQPTYQIPVRYQLNGTKQYQWSVKEFLNGGSRFSGYRTHFGLVDYGNVLVMTQSDLTGCVHVEDKRWPWNSYNDKDQMMLMAPYSNTANIATSGSQPKLDESIFGPEPAHRWCYYFEQADLALQADNWKKVVALGEEAEGKQLHPNEANRLELLPFLQAYAMLGDLDGFDHTVSKIKSPGYNNQQMCSVLFKMQESGYTYPPPIKERILNTTCK
jgi:hypothetical protein